MNNVYDVIIIGAGPAGLSAYLYALRTNLKTLIFEKDAPGGQLCRISKIENYPGYLEKDGAKLAYMMYQQVLSLGGEITFEEVVQVSDDRQLKKVKTKRQEYLAKYIVVASGITYMPLKVAFEKKYIGKGISYCAICDGALYQHADIGVVIEDMSHLKELEYLASYANKIYIITHLKDVKEFKNSKYEVYEGFSVKKLFGDDVLKGIEISSKEKTITLNLKGLFPFIGNLPSNSFLSQYPIFSSEGYLLVNEHFQSSDKNIFGVGDVIVKDFRQVVSACHDGASAMTYIASLK